MHGFSYTTAACQNAGEESEVQLAAVERILADFGAGYELWTDAYSSDAHLEV